MHRQPGLTSQKKSELISSETELISADVYRVLWISAEKRQNYETALFSADYLCDLNPGRQSIVFLQQEELHSVESLMKYNATSQTKWRWFDFTMSIKWLTTARLQKANISSGLLAKVLQLKVPQNFFSQPEKKITFKAQST